MGSVPTIYEDTRQQAGKHENKNRWWAAHGVTIVRRKLDFGDYATDGSNVIVDTKRSIAEVAMDCGRDHDRFVREMERAREAGYRLVVLAEVGGPYKSTDDVRKWVSEACRKRCERYRMRTCDPLMSTSCTAWRRKPMQGPTLMRIMRTMESTYGCRFEFCPPARSALRICELLGVDYE